MNKTKTKNTKKNRTTKEKKKKGTLTTNDNTYKTIQKNDAKLTQN